MTSAPTRKKNTVQRRPPHVFMIHSPKKSWRFLRAKTAKRHLIIISCVFWVLSLLVWIPPHDVRQNTTSRSHEWSNLAVLLLVGFPPLIFFCISLATHPAERFKLRCFSCGRTREEFLDRCPNCAEDYKLQNIFVGPCTMSNIADCKDTGIDRLDWLRGLFGFLFPAIVVWAGHEAFLSLPDELLADNNRMRMIAGISLPMLVAAATLPWIVLDMLKGVAIRRYTGLCLKCKSPLPADKSTEFCPTCGATLLIQQLRKAPYGIT